MENFNDNLEKLQKIVDSLSNETNLDKALELYNKGIKLSQECKEYLQTTNDNLLKVEK